MMLRLVAFRYTTPGHLAPRFPISLKMSISLDRLATKVSLFDPSFFDIGKYFAHNDCDFREDLGQPMNTNSAGRISRKDDPIRRDSVVYEDLDGHERGASARHLRVEKQHGVVLGDIRWELEIVKLRLACANVGLDQETSCPAIGNDSS